MPTHFLSALSLRARSSEIREFLRNAGRPGMISLAGGLPAEELFDVAGIAQASRRVLDRGGAALQYGPTEGQPALLQRIAADLQARGVGLEGRSVVVTTGSQQGLDLLARALIDPGDRIVVERPTYLAALQAFALCRPIVETIGQDAGGARVDELEALAPLKPKFVYVVPNFSNPTGRTLSLQRRLQLLEWAVRNEVMVIEDDPYGELRTDGEALPSLLDLCGQVPGARSRVGLVTTLSKTVAPGLRIGWAVLPEPVADAVSRIKQAADLHTSTFNQEIAAEYLASGALDDHLARLRTEYRKRRRALCGALRDAFGEDLQLQEPEGGMFVWTRFADGTDTRALLEQALPAGVCFVPGDAFFPRLPDRATMRLNFTGNPPGALMRGVARLREAHLELRRAGSAGGPSQAACMTDPDGRAARAAAPGGRAGGPSGQSQWR